MIKPSNTLIRRPRHFEVLVSPSCSIARPVLEQKWRDFLESRTQDLSLRKNGKVDLTILPPDLQNITIQAIIADDNADSTSLRTVFRRDDAYVIHLFALSHEEAFTEELQPSSGDDDEWTKGCDNLTLPHASLHGNWESLIFESKIKRQLLNYAQSALFFSEKQVLSNIVEWNRMILLHGPPGCGKTSLCRALAQKLSIRQRHRFPRASLLEIHSHSLFSKWFSTSGKLVSALFQMVRDMVEDDPLAFVCVLIDEVESLASSRSNSSSGDPSDAVRAVNSLLTSLDRLRSFPNVLVLATTNLTGSVDEAFVDRVDLKIHIGFPNLSARYRILGSCVEELARAGIIRQEEELPDFSCNLVIGEEQKINDSNATGALIHDQLLKCAIQSEGLSGRCLRKLPLQAHAQYLGDILYSEGAGISPLMFLEALFHSIEREKQARVEL